MKELGLRNCYNVCILYDTNAIKYFGEFAFTNFQKENYLIGEKNE